VSVDCPLVSRMGTLMRTAATSLATIPDRIGDALVTGVIHSKNWTFKDLTQSSRPIIIELVNHT